MSERRKPLTLPRLAGRLILGILRFLFVSGTLLVALIVFRVLNRTRVFGRANRRLQNNLFVVSNHQSLIDSFVVAMVLSFPQFLYKPHLLPWNLPEVNNFFGTPLLRFLMTLWKAIPVSRTSTRDNFRTFRTLREVLKTGVVHIFIEGTRSTTDVMVKPKPAVAKYILGTGASVLLVGLNGMHTIQPHAAPPDTAGVSKLHRTVVFLRWIFRIRLGNTVDLIVGPTLSHAELDDLAGTGSEAERNGRLAEEIARKIQNLKNSVRSVSSSAA